MRTAFFRLFCLLTFLLVILSACNLPVSNAAVESSTPTIVSTIQSTGTPTGQATNTLTVTATETRRPEPSETVTPQVPKAEVVRETNCRLGPAGNYDLVAKY